MQAKQQQAKRQPRVGEDAEYDDNDEDFVADDKEEEEEDFDEDEEDLTASDAEAVQEVRRGRAANAPPIQLEEPEVELFLLNPKDR